VTPEVIGGVVLVPLVVPDPAPGVPAALPDAVPLAVAELAPEVIVVLPDAVPLMRPLLEPEIGVVAVDGDVVASPVPVVRIVDDAESDTILVKVFDIPVDVADDSGVPEVFDKDVADAVVVLGSVIVVPVVVVTVVWPVEVAVVADVSVGEGVEVLVVCVSETVVLVLMVVVVVPPVVESGRIGTLLVEIVLVLLDDVVLPNDEQ
jgi:hypothetical protein